MPIEWIFRKLSLRRADDLIKVEEASENRPTPHKAFVVEQERTLREVVEETDGPGSVCETENLKKANEKPATGTKAIDDELVLILQETVKEPEGSESLDVSMHLSQSTVEIVETLEAFVTKFELPTRTDFNPEISLNREQKKECREMLRTLQNEVSIKQWQQARARLVRVCKGLSGARVPWVQDLAKLALFLTYRTDLILTGRPLDDKLNRVETETIAALTYLIETEDVIPDHIVGSGYMDDAFVLTEVFKALTKSPDGKKLLGH